MKITRQKVLADLVSARRCTYGAELGVWQAETLAPLLKQFPRLHMIGVDRWEPVDAYAGKDMEHARRIALAALRPYRNRVKIMQLTTVHAAALVDDGLLDFVFVDASHDTDSVVADVQAWLPKLKDDGILCGHDVNLSSVRVALDLVLRDWLELPAHCWLWIRP